MSDSPPPNTDFGFADVNTGAKAALVGEVFSRVAPYYDCMNDLMSGGMHRVWKNTAVMLGDLRPGMRVLDLACGSGDLSARILPRIMPGGQLTMADIHADMLRNGRKKAACAAVQCDGETLPFAKHSFDRVFIAFGLRNITNRESALSEMHRVLRPGGMCVILEFSPPRGMMGQRYLLSGLPRLGRWFFGDDESYRYLGESIMRFPPPEKLSSMMTEAGFARGEYFNLAAGIVSLHRARRLS